MKRKIIFATLVLLMMTISANSHAGNPKETLLKLAQKAMNVAEKSPKDSVVSYMGDNMYFTYYSSEEIDFDTRILADSTGGITWIKIILKRNGSRFFVYCDSDSIYCCKYSKEKPGGKMINIAKMEELTSRTFCNMDPDTPVCLYDENKPEVFKIVVSYLEARLSPYRQKGFKPFEANRN